MNGRGQGDTHGSQHGYDVYLCGMMHKVQTAQQAKDPKAVVRLTSRCISMSQRLAIAFPSVEIPVRRRRVKREPA